MFKYPGVPERPDVEAPCPKVLGESDHFLLGLLRISTDQDVSLERFIEAGEEVTAHCVEPRDELDLFSEQLLGPFGCGPCRWPVDHQRAFGEERDRDINHDLPTDSFTKGWQDFPLGAIGYGENNDLGLFCRLLVGEALNLSTGDEREESSGCILSSVWATGAYENLMSCSGPAEGQSEPFLSRPPDDGDPFASHEG